MTFAALETRLNASVLKHLSNAQASLSGVAVNGVFNDNFQVIDGGTGMASSQPAFTLATSDVPPSTVGRSIVIRGISYEIAEHRPDGTGMSVLLLEAV